MCEGRRGTVTHSMSEVSDACQHAGYASDITQREGFVIAFRSAGLDDHFHAGFDQELGSIGEGEEGIGSGDGTF